MTAPKLSIVIPTHNRAELLRSCLRSLEQQSNVPQSAGFEVIVADDGSVDNTRTMLKTETFDLDLHALFLPHGGANAARNRAAKHARSSLLLFLGDDMTADAHLVAAHLNAHAARPEPEVGVLGHIAWPPDFARTPFMQFLGEPDCPYQFCFTGFDPEDVPLGRMYSSHCSVKRSFFERHQGFDESFSLPVLDDIELECRFRKSDFRLVYEPAARVEHYHLQDFASFCRRMRLVGQVALPLFDKHSERVVVTDLSTLLTLRVDEEEHAQLVKQLRDEEQSLQQLRKIDATKGSAGDSGAASEMYTQLKERWRVALAEAAALGLQEAAKERGWTEMFRQLRSVGQDANLVPLKKAKISLGAEQHDVGMELLQSSTSYSYDDSFFEPVQAAGRECLRLLPNAFGDGFLYFQVGRALTAFYNAPLRITVEYLDIGHCTWFLQYDSFDVNVLAAPDLPGAFKCTQRQIRNRNTGRWRKATFRLDDWLFDKRCNHGDFRIAVPPHPDALHVAHLEIIPEPQSSREAADGDSGPNLNTNAKTGNNGSVSGINRYRSRCLTRSSAMAEIPPPVTPVHFEIASEPDISIIIPVYGGLKYTATCLKALKEATDGFYEVVVVDNASPDDTASFLAQCSGVRVLHKDTNEGFAAACNAGARHARGEFLVFLNNDTVPLPGWLSALYTALLQNSQAGVVGAKLLFPRGLIQHAGVAFHSEGPYHTHMYYPPHHPAVSRTKLVAAVTGACILLRRSDFESVGGFDERYQNGYEDIDLCLKLAKVGRTSLYCAEGVLYHCTSSTPGRFDHEQENYARFISLWKDKVPALLSLIG